ncbi:MAG TPA: hypothetical protein VH413_03655 [Verrucomicrobiae bacterium]|nr:hypothetical protein [Verrucomicrobiae bacterium]
MINSRTPREEGLRFAGVRSSRHFSKFFAALGIAALLGAAKTASADSYTWNAASGNWSTPGNWTPMTTGPNGPLATDTVVFGPNDTSSSTNSADNTVDASFAGTIASLTYNNATAGAPHVTEIDAGKTLTVTGSLVVGGLNANPAVTQVNFIGGGSLVASVTNATIENYNGSATTSSATLNLSGLSSFVFSNPTGNLSIADTTGSFLRAGGALILASGSNSITASNINLSTSATANGGPLGSITLGTGTNIINVANFNVSNNKNSASVSNQAGGLRIRGLTGTDASRANITLGNRNVANSTGQTTGSLLLNGAPVDIKAATLIVGEAPNAGAASSGAAGLAGNGVLQFDTGVIDATSLIMASNTSANSSGGFIGASTSAITVGANAKLTVGSGISLASQSSTGPATGTLTISNGTVVCNGNITQTESATGTAVGSIVFVGGGTLTVAGSIGGTTNPISNFTLDNNVTLQFALTSATQPAVSASTITWPSSDSTLNIKISSVPAGLSVGSSVPLFTAVNPLAGGTVSSPVLTLPGGATGNLSVSNTTVYLTFTGGVGIGIGGVNQLVNPGLETAPNSTGWATAGNANTINTGSATYYNAGLCPPDSPAQLVVSHTGVNVGNIYGQFPGPSSWTQTASTVAGSVYTAGAYTLASHEDLLNGTASFHYEVDFLDADGVLLSAYQSYTISNLQCGVEGPFPKDTWVYLAVTNQMIVNNGVNTGALLATVPTGVLTAPPNASRVQYRILVANPNSNGGSIYWDDANLGFISGPSAPVVSAITPNLVTLCTNTTVTATVTSPLSIITNIQVVVRSTTLGGITTNSITNGLTSTNISVTGIGTASVSVTYNLTPNTIYRSISVVATDANGVAVSSPSAVLDTLQPSLVIEASDFNYSNGTFQNTPQNGGLALYQGQVGVEGVDEHKAPRSSTQSYYRPSDAVIIEGAAPNTGVPPTGTEQKFVTAAANGDTNDIEVEVGFNSGGDWLNYTRTFGSGGSAPAGAYNVWAYLATSGSGAEMTLSQVTSDPTQPNQTSNVLGNFGNASFTDASYNSFVYVPLVDQFGNRVSVTLGTGNQTLKSTVVGNPNIGFYMLVPVAPIITPALQNVYPDGSTLFQATNKLSYTVSPANGAALTAGGVDLVVNGADVTSQTTITPLNGSLTVTYPLIANSLYTATLTVTNSGGLVSVFPVTFDTFNATNYQLECVDYDFSIDGTTGGMFIDNPVPTCDANQTAMGTLATNSYFGFPTGNPSAIALQGIDIHFPNDGQSATSEIYRNDGVGQEMTTDTGVRPKFTAARTLLGDPNIGPVDIGYYGGGYWMNYTRHYPAGTYNVWGRLAGGAGPFSGTTLSMVTSGVGTSVQSSNVLGTFSDPNAAGWQTWHWIPMRDANGNKSTVTFLGGTNTATLNLTSGNNLNAQFLMLTVAPIQVTITGAPSTSTPGAIGLTVNTLTGHTYLLLKSPTLNGAYTQVDSFPGNGSPHTFTQAESGTAGYFRIQVQ